VATPQPMAPTTDCILQPTLLALSDPAPLPPVRRSPTADTKANDRNISRPTHGPEALGLRSRARSDGSRLLPARSCRSTHKPALVEFAGSLSYVPAHTPAF